MPEMRRPSPGDRHTTDPPGCGPTSVPAAEWGRRPLLSLGTSPGLSLCGDRPGALPSCGGPDVALGSAQAVLPRPDRASPPGGAPRPCPEPGDRMGAVCPLPGCRVDPVAPSGEEPWHVAFAWNPEGVVLTASPRPSFGCTLGLGHLGVERRASPALLLT